MRGPSLETVHGFVGALNRRQVDAAVELFTPDAEFDGGPTFAQVYVGRPSIRSVLKGYLRAVPEMTFLVRDVFVNRNQVAVPIEVYATMGPNPDPSRMPGWREGRKMSWRGVFLFTLTENSEIRSLRIYGDERSTG